MIDFSEPPKLWIPERPAIIRPGINLSKYFPVEIDQSTRQAIVSELVKRKLDDNRSEVIKQIEAAIPFGMFTSKPLPSLSYLTVLEDNTNSTSYTFTGVSIGTAASNRLIVLSIFTSTDASPQMINTVTVAGTSATPVFRTTTGDPDTAIYYVNVPLGTTATIVVNLNGTDGRLIVGVWAIYNLSSLTPVSSDSIGSGSAATLSRTISVQKDGITIAAAGAAAGSSPVATNFITNFNRSGTESDHHLGGYDIPTTTASKTYSTTVSRSFGCAHWR